MEKQAVSDKKKSAKKSSNKNSKSDSKNLKREINTSEQQDIDAASLAPDNSEEKKQGEDLQPASDQKKVVDSKEKTPELKVVEEKEEDFKSKYFYLAAEFENYKKRVQKEKSNLIKFGNEELLRGLLECVDNFDRTIDALQNEKDEKVKNIVAGIEMVRKQFLTTFEKFGLKVIETENQIFDPNLHEAIAQESAPDRKEMEIIKEFQKGYLLNERLIRASKVIVVKAEEN